MANLCISLMFLERKFMVFSTCLVWIRAVTFVTNLNVQKIAGTMFYQDVTFV